MTSLTPAFRYLCLLLLTNLLGKEQSIFGQTNGVRINDRFPLTNTNELSPPSVLPPIYECAKKVGVWGFIPHSIVRVYAGNQLVGQINDAQVFPNGFFATVPLNRPLNLNEKITATQTVGNLTSVRSYFPVAVQPYDTTSLPKPLVSHQIYDCGRVVPVGDLFPSAYITVHDGATAIGEDETVATADAIFTSPLVVNHLITAVQAACPANPALNISGPPSAPVKVLPSPNPPPPPSVDPSVPGNDSVTLHHLYTGAEIEITDHGNVICSGWFATAKDNYFPVNPPVSAHPSLQATQKLCTRSNPSRPQTNTTTLKPLIILPPVCNSSQQVTIRGSTIDATVVVIRNGSQTVAYGGAVVGDLDLQLGGGLHLSAGDVLIAYQYMGSTISPASAPVVVGACQDVVTYHNDSERTGLNPGETILKLNNVNVSSFGRLFSHAVDGEIYAQPLCLSQVLIPNLGVHNIVYVVTEHDSVYAFDADSESGINAPPLWHVSFLNTPNIATIPSPADVGCPDMHPEIGCTSTPVIDRDTLTLYVASKTKETTGGRTHFLQRLHALDARTGQEKFGGPVVVADTISDSQGEEYVSGPTVPGSGESNLGNNEVFYNALRQSQRAGLALINGVVYLASASHCDTTPYHGWLLGYGANSLTLQSVLNTTPNATSGGGGLAGGGIWSAGDAPAADANGAIYFSTGNGVFDAVNGQGFPSTGDFGDSILKVVTDTASSPSNPNQNGWGVRVADFFTPHNQHTLWQNDTDLGSGGVMIIPDQPQLPSHLLVGAGKEGTVYLINRDDLGKYNPANDNQIVQPLPGAIGGSWSTAAYWNNMVYYNGNGDVLKAFRLNNGKLSTPPLTTSGSSFGYPGATPSISGNLTNAIVWTLQTDQSETKPPVLHAYSANTLVPLYNSAMAGKRDVPPGNAVKFTLPTVVNGKVFIGTSTHLVVFGNLF